jgi:hypothetical protein
LKNKTAADHDSHSDQDSDSETEEISEEMPALDTIKELFRAKLLSSLRRISDALSFHHLAVTRMKLSNLKDRYWKKLGICNGIRGSGV